MSELKPKSVAITWGEFVAVEPQTKTEILPVFFGRKSRRLVQITVEPIDEILHTIQSCRELEDGRGITAILRISHDQLEARSIGREPLSLLTYMASAIAICLVIAAVTGTVEVPLVSAGLLAAYVMPSVFWLFGNRRLLKIYGMESAEILDAARSGISAIAGRGLIPKHLYKDDVRMLHRLGKGSRAFAKVAKKIVEGSVSGRRS